MRQWPEADVIVRCGLAASRANSGVLPSNALNWLLLKNFAGF
jgi:hypothetical protein